MDVTHQGLACEYRDEFHTIYRLQRRNFAAHRPAIKTRRSCNGFVARWRRTGSLHSPAGSEHLDGCGQRKLDAAPGRDPIASVFSEARRGGSDRHSKESVDEWQAIHGGDFPIRAESPIGCCIQPDRLHQQSDQHTRQSRDCLRRCSAISAGRRRRGTNLFGLQKLQRRSVPNEDQSVAWGCAVGRCDHR